MDTYAKKIKTWREMAQLTQRQFAERADVHLNTVIRVEGGKNVTVQQLAKFAKVMGMSLSELVA